MTHSAEIDAPVRICCGQRHYGSVCPDGKVMCCACFDRFDPADLMVEDGNTYNVCKGCEPGVRSPIARVIPPKQDQS